MRLSPAGGRAAMRLFHTPGSPYARIVRMALRERGLEHRVEEVETTLRDPASGLLPLSPVGRVPALLLADGTVLTETALILPFLDRLGGPAPPLLDTADPAALARFGQVLGCLDGIAVWNRELRRPVDERSPGVVALEAARAARIADALEAAVAGDGFAGPGVDAAGIALAAVLGYCDRRHRAWAWREGRPKLAAWLDRFAARASFQATIPPPSGL